MINIGIIGLGKMGLLHAGIFNALENSKVTAIAEKNKLIVSALKNHLPKINMHTDYEKMLRKEDLDALVITTPVFLHKEMVFDAEDYGVNIFVEKPLAINGDECRSILEKKNNQTTAVGFCRRFIETYRLVKKLIDESTLGPVNFFQSQIFVEQVLQKEKGWFYDPAKSGGGVLMDLGSHALDLCHYFFGEINTVRAVGKEIYSESVEDYASLVMKFRNGVLGSLQASWSMRNYRLPETKFNIQFEEGMVTVTEKYVEIYSDVENDFLNRGWNTFYKQNLTKDVPLDIGGTEYTAEDQHFLDCINNDCDSLCNFKEASKTNFVIDHSYSSIQDGKTKKVEYGV